MSQTAYRTHHAHDVTEELIGSTVTISGWVDRRRDHGGVAFIDLRDASGLVQVVINDEDMARPLRSEFVVSVTGAVRLRPEGNENDHLSTGKVEIVADTIDILAKSAALPFQVSTSLENESETQLPSDEVRLKYRYLDLRRPQMHNNLLMRAAMSKAARAALDEMGFTEVETPTFIKSTPEGARDFLVPSRLNPGSWYALPQSPQLLKQLLMVSGIERYYQLARCYRDEDFRADRQPEFTQLDMEMAFVGQEDVIAMAERVLKDVWAAAGRDIQIPFNRISYKDAMDKYGSDKPDLRFGNEIVELTDYFKNTPFRVFQADYVGAVVYSGAADLPRRQFDGWQEWARQRGAKGLAYVQFGVDGELKGPVAKNLSDEERAGLKAATGAQDGDAVFFAAGAREASQTLLGAARVEIAKREGILKKDEFAFTWVVIPNGHRYITHLPCQVQIGWILSIRIQVTLCLILTTLCATVMKLVAVLFVFIAMTFKTVCLTFWVLAKKKRTTSLASCSKHSSMVLHHTQVLLSVGIVAHLFWLAKILFATLLLSLRQVAVPIH